MTRRGEEIAIIGLAGRFPGAADLDTFFENLRGGRVSLGPISSERLEANTLDPTDRYRVMGYLDDVDRFDHAFFDIPFAEACTLSPTARLLLQETWHAFESTGRPPEHFRGSRTDVYMTPTDASYCEFAPDEQLATMFTGNTPDFVAARINRQFDLRGTCAIVDASCASGLAALLLACDTLRLDRADYALVCGANLHLFPYARPDLLGTWSADGSSRSYSADASGMAPGEAVVCLVLTTRSRAEASGSLIHAVIRGGASNHCGAVSSSPSAPHSAMQAQAMVEAWTRARIAPHALGLLEGHGTATLLGDSLELEAFRLAFGDRRRGRPPCPLSSVKANIGHTQAASGLASVAKAVLALQHGLLLPSPPVSDVNSVLQRPDSPVRLTTHAAAWGRGRRLAGVHSLGMSGANTHLVLADYRPTSASPPSPGDAWFPAPVSARSGSALIENVTALRDWIGARDLSWANVAHTLSLGREPFEHRHLTFARDAHEFVGSIDAWLACAVDHEPDSPRAVPRVLLLCSSDAGSRDRLIEVSQPLLARFPMFRRAMEGFCHAEAAEGVLALGLQLALVALLEAMGISGTLVGAGSGKLTASVVTGALSREEAMRQAAALPDDPLADLEMRVSNLVTRQVERGAVVFIQLGAETRVSRQIRWCLQGSTSRLEAFGEDSVGSLGAIVTHLFADGWPLRFAPWFEGCGTRPERLPGYRFARTRCWIRNTPKRRAKEAQASAGHWDAVWAERPQLERRIAEITREQSGRDDFDRDQPLSEVGVDRRGAIRILERITRELDVRCDVWALADPITVAVIADAVRLHSSVYARVRAIWREVLRIDALGDDADFLALGGHSLLAADILLRLRLEFGCAPTFEQIFSAPTLRSFVTVMEAQLRAAADHGSATTPAATAAEPQPLTAGTWATALRRREL